MIKYNGYKNWNHWNVSLWINNDERLYRIALAHIKRTGNKAAAARHMFFDLANNIATHTPDGAKYSVTSIRKAMVGM